jgi:hypothetical protein
MSHPIKDKKVQFIIINRLGEFKLDPFEMSEDNLKQALEWFKDSDMNNFCGLIGEWKIIFPSALLKESILKYLEIKE